MNSALIGLRGRYAGTTLLWVLGVTALLAVPGGTGGRMTSHAVWMVLALLAALATWHRSTAEQAGRRGWRLIAAGLFMAATYSTLRLLRLAAGTPAPDLLLVFLTIAPYPLAVVGILQWPVAHRRQRLHALLDATIFAGSLFFLIWATGLSELVRDTDVSPIEVALNLIWFAGATLVLGIVAYAGGRSLERLYGPLGFIGAGILISMVSALFSARLTLTGMYFQAHPVELVWLLALLCFLLAALSPHSVTSAPTDDRDPTSFAGDLLIYLPAAAVLVVSFLKGAAHDPVLVVLGLAIGGAFIGRQFLALHDGRQLANGLERKVAERTRQLEASQAALVRGERMQAIGQVSGGVAHDFRNVLQTIYSQVEVLQLDVAGAEPRARLDAIQRAAESGSELVRSLLRIGSPDRGQPVELDLAGIVRGLDWMFRAAADAGLDVRLDGVRSVRVVADRTQLEQVVTNLVVNARDAMNGSGRLTIETGPAPGLPGRARIAVIDSGTGITPEAMARIFEPFYTTKGAQHGSGLGLSTVYAIVSELGGTINVQSTPGEGSCFEVLLPTPPTPSSR